MWIVKNSNVYASPPSFRKSFNLGKKFTNSKYNSPNKKDMAVCLAFFSPVNSKRLLNNYNKIRKKLEDAKIPNYTIELIKEQSLVEDVYFTVNSNSIMFYKENLWNIIGNSIPKKYKKLCFLDSDIIFTDPDWYEKTSDLLNYSNVVQPFENAIWLGEDGSEIQRLPCSAQFIGLNQNLNFSESHPGFSWALRRDFFENINGFYEYQVLGAGDALFAMALNQNQLNPNDYGFHESLVSSYYIFFKCIKKSSVSINYLEDCDAVHQYHGAIENRNYGKCSIEDLKFSKNQYGILEWRDLKNNEILLEMFRNRKEDE
jgi:hypothetical protein